MLNIRSPCSDVVVILWACRTRPFASHIGSLFVFACQGLDQIMYQNLSVMHCESYWWYLDFNCCSGQQQPLELFERQSFETEITWQFRERQIQLSFDLMV